MAAAGVAAVAVAAEAEVRRAVPNRRTAAGGGGQKKKAGAVPARRVLERRGGGDGSLIGRGAARWGRCEEAGRARRGAQIVGIGVGISVTAASTRVVVVVPTIAVLWGAVADGGGGIARATNQNIARVWINVMTGGGRLVAQLWPLLQQKLGVAVHPERAVAAVGAEAVSARTTTLAELLLCLL